jgi:hypothetical protein
MSMKTSFETIVYCPPMTGKEMCVVISHHECTLLYTWLIVEYMYIFQLFMDFKVAWSVLMFACHSPRNENLNLLVRIKFLNLLLYSSKSK